MVDEVLRVPPHSIESEQAVLGGLMINPDAYDRVRDIVSEADFYRRDHRMVFNAIAHLAENREPADVVTVIERLRTTGQDEAAGGVQYVGSLPRNTPASTNIEAYANVIRTRSLERRLAHNGAQMAELAWADMPLEEKADQAGKLAGEIVGGKATGRSMKDVLTEVVNAVDQRFNSSGPTGLQAGFPDLDRRLNGLQGSDLIIVAGRPSMGKTTFAMNIVENIAVKSGKRCAVFSMEMSDAQLVERSTCSLGRIDYERIQTGKLEDDEWTRLSKAIGQLNEADIVIDDTGALSIAQLRSRARRMHREKPLDLIVVDYLQLMRGEGENRTNEIGSISAGLKALAKELRVPVIALSQLNRGVENRPNKRPQMADLRESGAIEQDADVIIFLYRDEVYNPDTHLLGIGEAIIRKHRRGRTGTVNLTFLGHHCRFESFVGELPQAPQDNVTSFKYA